MAQAHEGPGAGIVRLIPLGGIAASPYQPRAAASEGLDELIASIREHGVLQPVLVRPAGAGFELVAGERRWRAAQAVGLAAIPAVVRELSDRDAAVLALVENLQRADLGFFEEAEAYRQLLDEFRLAQEDVAAQVGRSQPSVANKLRLLRLEPAVRQRISREGLSERHARTLLRLGTEEERLAAVEAFVAGDLSVREAEAYVERRLDAGAGAGGRGGRGAVRDVRTYFQAVEQVVVRLRRAGFEAAVSQQEDEGGWTLQLRIERQAGQNGPGQRRA